MNKIYLLGDIHGQFTYIKNFIEKTNASNDIIILLGDAGLNYYFNHKDEKLKDKMNKTNLTFFIIRGNHEERPSNCVKNNPEDWEIKTFWNNKVYIEKKYPNIIYALDEPAKYEIPTAHGILKTLVLPGAYSVDKYYRIQNGWCWFKDEQCSKEEMAVGTGLAQSDTWDIVLSHTCPAAFEPTDLFLPSIDQSTVDKTTEMWLGGIEFHSNYRLWAFGHYHHNRIYPTYQNKQLLMLFNDCALDVYKYLYGNYKISNCLIKINDDTQIEDFNLIF